MARRRVQPEYDSIETQHAVDNATAKVRCRRLADRDRVDLVALREAAQDHERRAKECRAQINGKFDMGPSGLGAGGEILPHVVPDRQHLPRRMQDYPEDVKALDDRDGIQATASRHRLEALANADALALGVDMAESLGASNSLEKALAHEIAVAHSLSMKMASRCEIMASQICDFIPLPKQQAQVGDTARLAGAAAKLMIAASKGAETLHKLRGGNPQQVIVQYVHVSEGGQAAIAGSAQNRGEGSQK